MPEHANRLFTEESKVDERDMLLGHVTSLARGLVQLDMMVDTPPEGAEPWRRQAYEGRSALIWQINESLEDLRRATDDADKELRASATAPGGATETGNGA